MSIKGNINNLLYKVLTRKKYLKVSYRWYHKGKLNIKNPRKFSEKLFFLKEYNKKNNIDLIRKCYDKYRVREYVKDIIGDKYLTKLYGVWDNADDICFSELPDKCIFKVTQSSGYNRICLNGYKKDENEIKAQLQTWLDLQNNSKYTEKVYKIENYYFDQKARIVCEELLEFNDKVPEDIRFYCFHGTPEFLTVDFDSVSQEGEKLNEYARNVYSLDGTFINVEFGRKNDPKYSFPCISNLEEMIEVSRKLSKPFEFVRVDLYNINGRIVFGELTWIPQGGAGKIIPEEFDLKLGEKLDIDFTV